GMIDILEANTDGDTREVRQGIEAERLDRLLSLLAARQGRLDQFERVLLDERRVEHLPDIQRQADIGFFGKKDIDFRGPTRDWGERGDQRRGRTGRTDQGS